MLERVASFLVTCRQACRRLISCISMSPIAFVLLVAAALILMSLILVFNVCMARLFTVPGAFLLNLGLFWLLLRLVVRVLVFPGSIVLWKRNTEASYRVEMAKQFTHHLEQLHTFLQVATSRTQSASPGATMEGAMLGCMVIEGLARNFRVQQRDQVRFTKEQAHVRLLVQGVEAWLGEAKVCGRRGRNEAQVPLTDWLQRMSQSLVPVPLSYAVASSPLVSEAQADAGACLERVEQLLAILDGLQRQQEGFCANARRFLSVPTVGSLHQLRAELLVRYSGHHYWVRAAAGRKIDAMFISCQGSEDGPASEGKAGSSVKEDVPLKEVIGGAAWGFLGPVVVWCNPNAAYYETMAYESHWLDFYLSQGCSVFLFNYSGFGRSQGNPTPAALAADGDAVIDFLRRRGFETIGVHGRSIGGIAACSLAASNPDVVKMLVADRTFSTLAKAAKYTFGNWAAVGLSLSATWADNLQHYSKARCYKVMICDPKDATIPDLASLRTAVAMQALDQVPANDRLVFEDDKVQRLAEAWAFFDTLLGICDRDDAGLDGHQAKRPARQPVVGKPLSTEADIRLEMGEEEGQRLVMSGRELHARPAQRDPRKRVVNAQWLEDHVDVVRAVMGGHIDGVRVALDVVGTQLNASGMTLDDALGRPMDEACYALRCFLANIQVWGSLSNAREPVCPATDKDVELLLQKGVEHQESSELSARLARLFMQLSPERLSSYHRQLARSLVAHVRREFRQCLSSIRRGLECSRDDGTSGRAGGEGAELRAAVLSHFREVEGLLSSIYRFFKCVDIAGVIVTSVDAVQSDDSEDARESMPVEPVPPVFDRNVIGYGMCIDCGHNGVLSEGEVQHLALHIRAAKFGKYAEGGNPSTSTKEAAGSLSLIP